MTISDRFKNFLDDFKGNSIEWALGMFKHEPLAKKYITRELGVQYIEVTFKDESVFRFVEKVGEP